MCLYPRDGYYHTCTQAELCMLVQAYKMLEATWYDVRPPHLPILDLSGCGSGSWITADGKKSVEILGVITFISI
jgi:hypothetical protein